MSDVELRVLAEAATRGRGKRSAYIFAASPDVVLGLLDRLAAAEAAVKRVREVARSIGQEHDVPLSVVVSLAGALDDSQEATGADLTASEAQDDPERHKKPADDGSKP